MSRWPATKARRVLAALQRIVWDDFVWAFHDGIEIGPRRLARIAKRTGLSPADL